MVDAAQQELPEPSCLFDLSEHGFDDLLTQAVATSITGAAISRLQQHEAELKRLGVEHLYMFGSTARGEAKDYSDVDLFFDYEKGKLGLFELMNVKEYAAGILGRKADIMTRDSLHKVLREKIESTAVRVF